LREEIARRFSVQVQVQVHVHVHVHVHDSTVGKWRRQLGLTRLQPRPCHPKSEPVTKEAFKKRVRVAGPPVAGETGCAILIVRGAAEKFMVDSTP
jgi:hypothetical protein